MPLATRVVLDDRPFIHPLLELLDEGRPAGALLASQDEARLLEWRLGELRTLEHMEPEVIEAPYERSGPVGSRASERASPKREQRQARERDEARRFLDRVQAAAERLAGEHGWERILVSGGDRFTEPLAAALGLSEVVGALDEGRVTHLVYDPEVRYEGSIGPDGGLHAGDEAGPGEGRRTAESRLTERLVERALETGARVTPVEGAAAGALAEAAGVAALLRW